MPYLLFSSTPDSPVSAPQHHRLMMKPKASSGIRDMLICAFFAILQAVLIKTLAEKLTEVLFIRSMILLLVLCCHLFFTGKMSVLTHSFSQQMLCIGALGGLGICLFYYSLSFLTLTEAISVYSIILVLNSVLQCIVYKERSPRNLGRVGFCCILGLLLIAQPGFSPTTNEANPEPLQEPQDYSISHVTAVIICLISTGLASGSQLITTKINEEHETNIIVIYVNALIFAVLGGWLLLLNENWPAISFIDVVKIIGIAGSSIIGISFAQRALKSDSSRLVSAFSYSQVVYSLLWDILLFHQFPDVWSLIGSALLIGSCLFLLLK